MLWCTWSSMFQSCSGEVYIGLPGLLPSSRLPNSDKKWGQRRAAPRPPHPAHFTPARAIAPWTSPVYHASSSFQYTFTRRPTAAWPLGVAAATAAFGLAALLPDLADSGTASMAAGECAVAAGTASALPLAAATSPATECLSSFAGEGAAAVGVEPAPPFCTGAGGQQAATAGLTTVSHALNTSARV